ncbi:hypothetical protein [Shewanella violacea]|nr:hypothetical protein [Shewanella violacea]
MFAISCGWLYLTQGGGSLKASQVLKGTVASAIIGGTASVVSGQWSVAASLLTARRWGPCSTC